MAILDKEKEQMITHLINGEKITDIAKLLNRSRQTIYDWIKLDEVKAELDRRKRELANQGNNYILKDLYTYLDNIKELANDKSDKRVCLSANQYLINRIFGNPTTTVETNEQDDNDNLSTNELELELSKYRRLRKAK